jgi:hypothetical protein
MDKVKLPKDKPLYVYMKEMKENTMKENEKKYSLILEFINKATKMKLKNLCNFTHIDIEKINKEYFFDILNDYKDRLIVDLGIQINEYEMDIIDIIAVCVESIDYSVHRKHVLLEKKKRNPDSPEDPAERIEKKKIFLSIINKPKRDESYSKSTNIKSSLHIPEVPRKNNSTNYSMYKKYASLKNKDDSSSDDNDSK